MFGTILSCIRELKHRPARGGVTCDHFFVTVRRDRYRAAALGFGLILALGACAGDGRVDEAGPLAPEVVAVPAGEFIQGSDGDEREAAYSLDEAAYGHSVTREQRWYAGEVPRAQASTAAFDIMTTPVSNADYAVFVAATGHRSPKIDAETWAAYGLVHRYERTRRHAWRGTRFPGGRAAHPVVLVSHDDARAYAAWLSRETGARWRLPSEEEWEKAARGADGRRFPWGEGFDEGRLNSADAGPFDTVPVGEFRDGASPYGMLDAAGQVYEWTATAADDGRFVVKGGSWDDAGCGVCRPAARHARPGDLRHILIGFRLVRERG